MDLQSAPNKISQCVPFTNRMSLIKRKPTKRCKEQTYLEINRTMHKMGSRDSSRLPKVAVIGHFCHFCSLSLSKQKPKAVSETSSLNSRHSSVTLLRSKDNKSNSPRLGNKFCLASHHRAGLWRIYFPLSCAQNCFDLHKNGQEDGCR